MKSVPIQPDPTDPAALDLGAIPGVRDHFNRTSDFPILVFREARSIRVILCPFPGTWKFAGARDSRSLMPGSNTFPTPLTLAPGDEVAITPTMSAVASTGPRVQVPAILPNEIGELEGLEEISELPEVSEGDAEEAPEALVGALFSWDDPDQAGGAA